MSQDTYTIRPFQRAGHYTVFDNLLLDWLMPKLKGNAWKTFCFLLRQTRGWQRDSASPSYKEIMEGTGIGSEPTVYNALNELRTFNLITTTEGKGRNPSTYRINEDAAFHITREGQYRRVESLGDDAPLTARVEMQVAFAEASADALLDRPVSFATLRSLMMAEAEAATPAQEQAVLRNTCKIIYGFEPSYKEVGGWKKQQGGMERAMKLLFRYAHADVVGNVLHYIAAAEARRRADHAKGGQDVVPDAPEHLALYTHAERRYFTTEKGYDAAHFPQAGTDPLGNRQFRYVDPDKTANENAR